MFPYSLRTLLIVLASVAGLVLLGFIRMVRDQSINVVFGAPSSVMSSANLVASVAKTSTGHRIEVFDLDSTGRVWQSRPEHSEDVNPCFARDGSILYFERWAGKPTGIWAKRIPGGDNYPITTQHDCLADVSPTGKRIIVRRVRDQSGMGLVGESVLLDTDNGAVELDVFGAGGLFLSDDEVLYCERNGDELRRKSVGAASSRRLCKGVFPVLDLGKQRFLCVAEAAVPFTKREWTLHDLNGRRLGVLGPATGPVFSVSGNQVLYISPKLNGQLWMWDMQSNIHRPIGTPGYISQMRTTPSGVMFFLHEGTDAIVAATIDETAWTVRTLAGPLNP